MKVTSPGRLRSHQGINLPGAALSVEALTEKDLADLDWTAENPVEYVGLSFVRQADGRRPAPRKSSRPRASKARIVAKIEKPQAVDNLDAIIAETDAVMVARGDLGVEMDVARVPAIQKRIIAACHRARVPVITATQMLNSMENSSRPTRAEATDVFNAVLDGTDAVMLSGETAVGEYPVEAVRMMSRIAREVEPELPHGDWLFNRTATEPGDVASSVARAAVGATYTLGLAALVVPTRSGRTARLLSAHRPKVPVLAVSPRLESVRRLNLLFGVQCVIAEDWTSLRDLLDDCARLAREEGVAKSGQLIAITAGLPEQGLGTNLFEIHRVP